MAAAAHFSQKFKVKVTKSTIHSIKNDYCASGREKRRMDDGVDVQELPEKKHGQPLLLGECMDKYTWRNLGKEGELRISSQIVIAAAQGIILAYDKFKLAEFGGHVELKRAWVNSLFHRMQFVQRKASTSKCKISKADFTKLTLMMPFQLLKWKISLQN